MTNNIFFNLKDSFTEFKKLDRKVVIIFITVAILNIISYYFSSRRFFRNSFSSYFANNEYLLLLEFLYWLVSDFITYFIFPLVIIKFFLKEKLNDFGFIFGNFKLGFKVVNYFLLFFIPILWVVSSFPSFSSVYPHLSLAKTNFNILLIYEIGMLLYMFAWEFIWRGFFLFGLEKPLGWYAIFIQMIPFVILHNGKPLPETVGAIAAGIALGVLAFKTRSFLYGFIIHFLVIFSIDFMGYIRYNLNYYKILF